MRRDENGVTKGKRQLAAATVQSALPHSALIALAKLLARSAAQETMSAAVPGKDRTSTNASQ